METRVYNPEGSILRKDQMMLLDVLNGFADVCKEHDIKWWMCSGTLLGAMRHGGFIPWDDDIDVAMYKKDYRRFLKVIKKWESDKFAFQSIQTDPEHTNVWGVFRYKKLEEPSLSTRGMYGIDVFCIEKSSQFAAHMAKFFYKNMMHPTKYIKNAGIRQFVKKVVKVINFGFLIPLTRVLGWINPKKQFHYELGSGFYDQPFYAENIFPLTQVEFEGIAFPSPGKPDEYLTALYGDWRKLPSEDQIKEAIHYDMYKEQIYGE
jgi:lipopolysaccharide cholinephosphotransferase